MKKGHIFLILFGLALLAFLYFSPVTPSSENTTEEEVMETPEEGVTELDPDLQLDQALQELQDTTTPPMQSIMKIRRIAEEHPENQRAQLTLGLLSLQTGQFENAIRRFSNLVSLDSTNGESWKYLALARLEAGDTVEARKDFENALKLADDKTAMRFRTELPALVRN